MLLLNKYIRKYTVRSDLFIWECYIVHTVDHKSSSLECYNTKGEKIVKNISSTWQEVFEKKP